MTATEVYVSVEDKSFSGRVLQFGFSVKSTLKQRLACRMFIKGTVLGSNVWEQKKGTGERGE